MTMAEFYSGLRFLLYFGNSSFRGCSPCLASALVLNVLAVVKFMGMAVWSPALLNDIGGTG